MQSLAWLNTRTIAVMDTKERLHVIDARSQEELEVVDLAHLGLVYATPHYKAIATGGNVSRAMVRYFFKSFYKIFEIQVYKIFRCRKIFV